AAVLLGRGWQITGSDLVPEGARWLSDAGIEIQLQTEINISRDLDLLIYSEAIEPQTAERRRAAELGIPQLSYPAMLGRLMAENEGLAVAGTHGKSTTVAMTASILLAAGLDPTVVLGARVVDLAEGFSPGGRSGAGKSTLVEACEYREHFLQLAPRMAVLLGIEPDHFDCFDSWAELEMAFRRFAARVPADGQIIASAACAATRRTLLFAQCRYETFGDEQHADWQAADVVGRGGCYAFQLQYLGHEFGRMTLRVPGRHQVHNALAAAALGWHAGATVADIHRGLRSFAGLERRLETRGTWQGITLVDDYAHHPTELDATLAAAREMYPKRRLWCVFQPHQVSRTRRLLDEFAASLQNADRVAVAEIFRAREGKSIPGEVTARDLAARTAGGRADVLKIHRSDDILEHIAAAAIPGDVVLTVGAGDIRKVSDGLVERLGKYRAAG
ncbi:MAG TPA: UDP-N-acetylmuramate--L-alanine ligase, partial [Pirellulales bacterium]|nr:UDP-N-acetylmuramate--L-alanine ligase [Pirellulales bacterium]